MSAQFEQFQQLLREARAASSAMAKLARTFKDAVPGPTVEQMEQDYRV